MPAGVTNAAVEYVKPGAHATYTASAAITNTPVSGVVPITLVEITGNRAVGPAGAGSTKCVGGALHDAASGATNLTVVAEGVWPIKASGAIAAGDNLICGAAGTVVAAGATPDARTLVGKALEAISSGAVGRCKLNLG